MLSSAKDDNFCFPIPDVLETEKLRLVPFIVEYFQASNYGDELTKTFALDADCQPSLHAEAIINAIDIDTWQYLTFGAFTSAQEFIDLHYEVRVHQNNESTYFVGLDKTRLNSNGEPTLAGLTGYIHANPEHLGIELCVLVLPQFRRTHIGSHMIGLLMQYALNLPTHPRGGLGLRRVQWEAYLKNKGSIGLAMKMGFKMEGVKRWSRVLQHGKEASGNGLPTRRGDPREEFKGFDTACLAICWDEWEEEGKRRVEEMLLMQ